MVLQILYAAAETMVVEERRICGRVESNIGFGSERVGDTGRIEQVGRRTGGGAGTLQMSFKRF